MLVGRFQHHIQRDYPGSQLCRSQIRLSGYRDEVIILKKKLRQKVVVGAGCGPLEYAVKAGAEGSLVGFLPGLRNARQQQTIPSSRTQTDTFVEEVLTTGGHVNGIGSRGKGSVVRQLGVGQGEEARIGILSGEADTDRAGGRDELSDAHLRRWPWRGGMVASGQQ